jgi:hypothetical protein
VLHDGAGYLPLLAPQVNAGLLSELDGIGGEWPFILRGRAALEGG